MLKTMYKLSAILMVTYNNKFRVASRPTVSQLGLPLNGRQG